MDKISESFEARTPREAAALRALARAYQRGAHNFLFDMHTESGRTTARYGLDVFTGYKVQIDAHLTACTCRAGEVGMLCLHVAALADKAGCFDYLIPSFYERAFGPAPIDPTPVAVGPTEAARADVIRLGRNPKSTADWHALQAARARLASFELVAA